MAEEVAPKEPTMADLKAIADEALKAANEAKTELAAQRDAPAAAQREAQSRGLELPPELLQQIGDAMSGQVVEKLRAEFEVANPTPASPADSSAPATDASEAVSTTPDTTAPSGDAPPKVKTWAAKFLGE